jgi:NAD(P)-dependent dehydrogenase (short-subunit alcohol dehydrogenase family)
MSLDGFDGITAVVTGGGNGIGRAICLRLAAAGSDVAVVDVRREDAEAVAGLIAANGGRSLAVGCDVSDREDVAALGESVTAWARDGVQLLCNNAGVFTPRRALTATHHDWEWVIGICLWGVVHGIEEFLPGMVASGRPAHVLNTASMNGYVPNRHSALYSTAKYAVVGLTETLRRELAGTGVGATLLNPSAVTTEIGRSEEVRPTRFARERQDPDDDPFADYGLSRALSPDRVAELALQGVLEDRAEVFTDHVVRDLLVERHARLMGALDRLPEDLA